MLFAQGGGVAFAAEDLRYHAERDRIEAAEHESRGASAAPTMSGGASHGS